MKNSWKNKTSSFLKAKTLVSKSGKILNSSLENRNLKDFESLLESKQKLLKEQKTRTKNASLNLTTYFRNKQVVAFHRIIKSKNDLRMNLAAVKIQKVVRGFLIRKSTLRIRSELEKQLMIGKILEIKQTVDSLFYLNKYTENAVIKIQRAFRNSRVRKTIKIWCRLYSKIMKVKELKSRLKTFMKIFHSKQILKAIKSKQIQLKLLEKFKITHLISRLQKFWRKHKLSYEKFIRKIKRYKLKLTRNFDEKINYSAESQSRVNNDDLGLSRRSSTRKRNQLPLIPMTTKSLKQKAMIFLIKPKKITSRINSKSVQSTQYSENSLILPKI